MQLLFVNQIYLTKSELDLLAQDIDLEFRSECCWEDLEQFNLLPGISDEDRAKKSAWKMVNRGRGHLSCQCITFCWVKAGDYSFEITLCQYAERLIDIKKPPYFSVM
jgi:hypothetical protein